MQVVSLLLLVLFACNVHAETVLGISELTKTGDYKNKKFCYKECDYKNRFSCEEFGYDVHCKIVAITGKGTSDYISLCIKDGTNPNQFYTTTEERTQHQTLMLFMKKNLSVAFLWHMHQPVYQDTYEGIFFMPWVRLHAVKDYLDMLYKIDEFDRYVLLTEEEE